MRERARESEVKLSHMATVKYKLGELLGAGAFSDVRKLGDGYAIKLPGEAASELFLLEMNYFIALSARGLAPIIYNIDLNRNIVVVNKLFPIRSVVDDRKVDVDFVGTEVLRLMSHLAICGVGCCDMKLENVAFNAGVSRVLLIDPGLEFTCFLWGDKHQNDDEYLVSKLAYALVTGMLTIFIVASFCTAVYNCPNPNKCPDCTCGSCSKLRTLRKPFEDMYIELDTKPLGEHAETQVFKYDESGRQVQISLLRCFEGVHAHYA
jgi:hypothetical protein